MASTKLIVVFGATGNQGGSVINTFLSDAGWRVRGITRNAQSAKAQALAAKGVEVVEANLDSTETLKTAFLGAHAIFAVTDFWGLYGAAAQGAATLTPGEALNEHVSKQETQQLKNVINAAAEVATLDRLVLSSLSNATKWSKGKYTHVFHFDAKANAVEYARDTYPDLWAKTSVFQAGFFLGNFTATEGPSLLPVKNAENIYQFIGNLEADVKLPFIAAEEDSGPFVQALINEPAGKNIIAYREWLTMQEFAAIFSDVTGLKSEIVTLPKGQSNVPLPPDLALEFADNWAYWNEFGYEGRDDPTLIHPKNLSLPLELSSVADYLQKQDWDKLLSA
ncbi:hypothetical protein Golomagni_06021 [Golovinomyces magnicellulatus]|nr:hypothetical protein Golomagni_06021 [Golovinomyces magnicellulatus]